MIENIERHMREFGKSAARRGVDAMREVLSAVVVIASCSWRFPAVGFSGRPGRMYRSSR